MGSACSSTVDADRPNPQHWRHPSQARARRPRPVDLPPRPPAVAPQAASTTREAQLAAAVRSRNEVSSPPQLRATLPIGARPPPDMTLGDHPLFGGDDGDSVAGAPRVASAAGLIEFPSPPAMPDERDDGGSPATPAAAGRPPQHERGSPGGDRRSNAGSSSDGNVSGKTQLPTHSTHADDDPISAATSVSDYPAHSQSPAARQQNGTSTSDGHVSSSAGAPVLGPAADEENGPARNPLLDPLLAGSTPLEPRQPPLPASPAPSNRRLLPPLLPHPMAATPPLHATSPGLVPTAENYSNPAAHRRPPFVGHQPSPPSHRPGSVTGGARGGGPTASGHATPTASPSALWSRRETSSFAISRSTGSRFLRASSFFGRSDNASSGHLD